MEDQNKRIRVRVNGEREIRTNVARPYTDSSSFSSSSSSHLLAVGLETSADSL